MTYGFKLPDGARWLELHELPFNRCDECGLPKEIRHKNPACSRWCCDIVQYAGPGVCGCAIRKIAHMIAHPEQRPTRKYTRRKKAGAE